jgi:hypothetical protein
VHQLRTHSLCDPHHSLGVTHLNSGRQIGTLVLAADNDIILEGLNPVIAVVSEARLLTTFSDQSVLGQVLTD